MKFVILEHRQVEARHWDLLLEMPYADARSWALEECPPGIGWRRARELDPHRELYFRYEGPISGSRGHVLRWDEGNYELLADARGIVRLICRGQQICGILELEHIDEAAWRYRFFNRRFEVG